ncbi:MAG: EAL domain-containing protein [Thiotrichales bacterium]|nr:MAG: EAL domain-containing protein [Thiotrichales bacterium]
MKQHLNHTIGIILVLPLLIFFFYKSVFSSNDYDELSSLSSEIASLQVRLHRDMLRHRNNQIREYDTLNQTIRDISILSDRFAAAITGMNHEALAGNLAQLQGAINEQTALIEAFKTSNSVLQRSLDYYSRMQTGDNDTGSSPASAEITGQLSASILAYSREPENDSASKIRLLLDRLNIRENPEAESLARHSLNVIEKLPLIDSIIEKSHSLSIKKQTRQLLTEYRADLDQHMRIYNTLLFFASLYLLGYISYMVLILKQNKNTLMLSNRKLNKEIEKRSKTEKTLYRLVKETSSIDDKDFVRHIVFALYKALGYRYTFVSLVSEHNKEEASILGVIDNGKFQADIKYRLDGTPCEEVLRFGRLVHNRDFSNYFPEWNNSYIPSAESFIGVCIKDQDNKVIGLIAVADDQPINNSNLAENILSLAASRTSAELLRHNALQHSQRYHTGLESIDRWLLELIACSSDPAVFYETVCKAALDIAGASMALVPLLDGAGKYYRYAAASGCNSEHLSGTRHELDNHDLFGWVITNSCTVHIDDINSDTRARRQKLNRYRVKSAYITPILLNESTYGAIAVFGDAAAFDHIDAQLIGQFAQRLQLAIANLQLVNEIATEKERAEFTLRSIGDAVITTDADGMIEYMNHIAERLTGWELDTVHKQPVQTVFRILDHDTREPMHNIIDACLNEGTTISKSMTYLINNNGSERSIESSMSPIINRSGAIEGAVLVFHDETERRRMECIIHHQATHDSLTGLINRSQFNKELKDLVHHAKTHEANHVLCYLDLDHFKIVNDTCGHAAGDELLKQVSSMLHSTIRSGDTLGRLGGDEFGLILQNCPVDVAQSIANKIINSISEYEFIWEGNRFTIGVSIGIVAITAQTENTHEAMKHADVACYTAKDQGRDRSYVYDQQDTELIKRHEELHWASRISKALEQDRFRIFAQSICPLDPAIGNIAHIEILVRMEDENSRLIPPASFIPAAERYNLMGAVDQHIIRETFSFIAEQGCENICFSINLSGSSLNDNKLADFVKQCRKEYGIAAETICFEITETSLITNLIRTRDLVRELQAEGFKFALDDFGSRLSSFSYLENLPVDFVKIDGSFVREMVDNKIDHAMVAAINQIGHIMEIKTIAEFAENDDIIEKLHTLGVDFAQGYGIARPRPLNADTLQDMISHRPLSNGIVSAS